MALISVPVPSDGETIDASDLANPINLIVSEINGNLDSNNLAANAVTEAKIATGAVTAGKIAADAITSIKIANASVTADKLGMSFQEASVATAQTTSSITAADLSTVGPSVTVTVGANGRVLLIGAVSFSSNATSALGSISYSMSGANSGSASLGSNRNPTATQSTSVLGAVIVTGLTAGSTTFKLQYSTNSGTATFSLRNLQAIAL